MLTPAKRMSSTERVNCYFNRKFSTNRFLYDKANNETMKRAIDDEDAEGACGLYDDPALYHHEKVADDWQPTK